MVEPLDTRLPANLAVESPEFMAHDSLPHTLTLKNWLVGLSGSLANGFVTESSATLPGTTGDIQVALRGWVTTHQASGLVLSLSAPAAKQRQQPGPFDV